MNSGGLGVVRGKRRDFGPERDSVVKVHVFLF